ncbi:MAG: hypothetical protein DRQ41_16020 [Gammaproteobacteria bacterium]|nr:MAG: hypothetical protein DRQ41_16020 [Gammaproteobacteria bacterium]
MHRGRNDRVTGWYALHNYLTTKLADGLPMMQFFDGCSDTIRTLPMLTVSKTNPEDVDTRTEDHCFIGSTKVRTLKGLRTLKELVDSTGEILGVGGYTPYENCRLTRENARVIKITFDDNRTITCTPDHKFMLWDGSWCNAIDLGGAVLYNKEWNTNTESFNVTRRSGKMLTVLYRKAIKSITKTITSAMMTLRTLSSWKPQSTEGTIFSLESHRRSRKRQEQRLSLGIRVRKGLSGIDSSMKDSAEERSTKGLKRNVSNAERHSRGLNIKPFAPTNVSLNGEENLGLMMCQEYVSPVGKRLPSISITRPRNVPQVVRRHNIVRIEEAGDEDVYCLSVPKEGSFDVNGYIVSNCGDEVRYATLFIKNKIHAVPTWEPKNDSYSLLRRKIGGNGRRSR